MRRIYLQAPTTSILGCHEEGLTFYLVEVKMSYQGLLQRYYGRKIYQQLLQSVVHPLSELIDNQVTTFFMPSLVVSSRFDVRSSGSKAVCYSFKYNLFLHLANFIVDLCIRTEQSNICINLELKLALLLLIERASDLP